MLKRTLLCILLAGSCGLMTAAQAQQPPGPWLATYLLRQCVSAATLQVYLIV